MDDLTAGGEDVMDGGGEVVSLCSEPSNVARALHNALANRNKAGVSALSSRDASLT